MQARDTNVLDILYAETASTSSLIESSLKCILVSESQTVKLSIHFSLGARLRTIHFSATASGRALLQYPYCLSSHSRHQPASDHRSTTP